MREVHEETGLDARWARSARVYSAHLPGVWRDGRRVDAHALRIVYDGWVPVDSPGAARGRGRRLDRPRPRGTVADVLDGTVPVVPMVLEALADHRPFRKQRVAAYALIRRAATTVLLTRISARGHHSGSWTLPGGGVDHGESPRRRSSARCARSAGCAAPSASCSTCTTMHFNGTAPSGRYEDYHGVHLIFAASLVEEESELRVVEIGGHHRRGGLGAGRRRGRRGAARARRGPARVGGRGLRRRDDERDRLHLRRARAEVRPRSLGGDRSRPAEAGARRVLLVTDPGVAATGHPARIAEQIARARPRRDDVRRGARRADRRVDGGRGRIRARRPGRSTRSSRSAAARRSTPPRRSTCSSPTPAS